MQHSHIAQHFRSPLSCEAMRLSGGEECSVHAAIDIRTRVVMCVCARARACVCVCVCVCVRACV